MRAGERLHGGRVALHAAAALAACEAVQAIASRAALGTGAGTAGSTDAPAIPEAVVVLGHADTGEQAGSRNRRRVRAGLRSLTRSDSLLVLSGGAVAGSVSEARLMAAHALRLGYRGSLVLEEGSRSTWENVLGVIPLIEGAARIVIVSDPVHALKARLLLRRARPDLGARLARADDHRIGERGPGALIEVPMGLIDLGLSALLPGWAEDSATGLEGLRRLLAWRPRRRRRPRLPDSAHARQAPEDASQVPRRSRPSVISSREDA